MIYDIAIIGGGAAGLSAAIYGARGGMNVVVFEDIGYGGQINYTSEVDNYLGISSVSGAELADKMRAHAAKYDCTFKSESIRKIENVSQPVKKLITRKNVYEAKAIILATGAKPRKLGVFGEDELAGAGVSYCATCDGAFYRDKTTVVIGGGNTAFEDALYLAGICKKVYIIHRNTRFRADQTLVNKAYDNPVIEIITDCVVEKIQGEHTVKSIVTKNTVSHRIGVIDTDAVFIAIGRVPESTLYADFASLADDKSIITDEKMQIGIPGLFAAGDVRKTPLRQIITAAADGAVAGACAVSYINSI